MKGDEKARYTNVIRFSEVVLKMARKKTSGEAAVDLQTNGDRTRWKLSVWMISRSVHEKAGLHDVRCTFVPTLMERMSPWTPHALQEREREKKTMSRSTICKQCQCRT